jgi:hypothetical protein
MTAQMGTGADQLGEELPGVGSFIRQDGGRFTFTTDAGEILLSPREP